MARSALTAAFLRTVKPPATGQIEHADGGCPGLRLRLSHGGAATWVLGCRDTAGKPRRFTLGAFPAIGLAEARQMARTQREAVRKGADPIREAREARARAAGGVEGIGSLTALIGAYETHVGQTRRSWAEARRRIEHVFSRHMATSLASLTAPMLQLTVDAHPSRSSAGAAVRYVRPVLRWGAKRGFVAAGIAEALDQPEGALKVRQRRLTAGEVTAILRALEEQDAHARVVRWLFLTMSRLNEGCSARWRDIDMQQGIWTIAETKQGRPHVVPLPRQALTMLRSLQPRDAEGMPVDPAADALVFTGARGAALDHWDRWTKRLQATSSTKGWHRHDIRRTAASMLGDLGVAPHVIEMCLGHALRTSADGSGIGRVAATYNTSRYRREHADALQLLADELDRLEEGDTRVVRLVHA